MSDEKKTEGIRQTSGDVSDLIADFRGKGLDVTTPGCKLGPVSIGPFTIAGFTLPPLTFHVSLGKAAIVCLLALAFILHPSSCILSAEPAKTSEVDYPTLYADGQTGKPMIVLCGASWCPGCHAMRCWLNDDGIRFTWLDVDNPPSVEIKSFYALPGSIPQVIVARRIGGRWLIRRGGLLPAAGIRGLLRDLELEAVPAAKK